jgi:alkyl sulfatase BDS1-like metallo-beta-lactamase superfamily hydrolase
MVIIADEFFTGIPNMHSIRGSKPRIPDNYLGALDRVLEIGPEWLLGSHIMPIQGKDHISETIARYRDATQYLWDQSIRLINKGYTPVELQHELKDLPEHFHQPPYTVPMYGTPFTTVPEFFTGWVSWFDGDATDLFPSEPRSKAAKFVQLMGGTDTVLDAAKTAHADGDHQFAAELAQLVVRADPALEDAKLVKAAALRARGYQELNPIARSWYLTGALELEGALDPDQIVAAMMSIFAGDQSGRGIVEGWRYRLDAAAAGETRLVVVFRVSDDGDEITVRLRNGVLTTSDPIEADADADVVVETTASRLATDPAGGTVVSGDGAALARLVGFLDLEVGGFQMHAR